MKNKIMSYLANKVTAKNISRAVGAGPLVDYLGSKGAKLVAKPENRKYVTDTTSGRKAAQSAATLAMNIGTGGSGLLRLGGRKVASAVAKKTIAKAVAKTPRAIPKTPNATVLKIPNNKPIKVIHGGANPTSLRKLKGDTPARMREMHRVVRGMPHARKK
jgi:hypothetical protein